MRIGVAGYSGRMGQLVAAEVAKAGGTLVGGTARSKAHHSGVPHFESVLELARACDVIIDFTHPSTVMAHASAICAGRAAWVLGTTGLSVADEEAVCGVTRQVAVVQAANFSPGVTLVLAVAERLAAALPAAEYDAEIVEMHHRNKVDAPSGTALALGRAVASGRGVDFAHVAQLIRVGQTGARPDGAIGFAALRGGQVVGEHSLLFAGDSEHIALTHRALDRRVFARGAIRAAFWAGGGRRPGLYSMMAVLGLAGIHPASSAPK